MVLRRHGEDVMQAIKNGDRQGLEMTLHSITKRQAQRILHYTYRYRPHQLLTPLLAMIKFRRIHMMRYVLNVYQLDVEQKGVACINYTDKNHHYEMFMANDVTPLWYAVAEDLHEFIYLLVETYHADVRTVSDSKTTPLHLACVRGNFKVIELLLKHGADPDAKSDNDGLTPLLCLLPLGLTIRIAIATHNTKHDDILDKVKLLVQYGADVNARSRKAQITFLHSAAEFGRVELYKYLLKKGAKFAEDRFRLTPLHCACLGGKEKLQEYICSLSSATVEDQLTALELRFVHTLQERPLLSHIKLREVLKMRKKVSSSKNLPQQDSSDIVWLDDDKPCRIATRGIPTIWKEGLLICAKHFGTDSIQFALRLFMFSSHQEAWKDWEIRFMMRSALEILCLKQKFPTNYLPIFVTVQMMRHAESSGQCHQHGLPAMLEVIQMATSVLQSGYNNTAPMITGRSISLIEITNFYKATADALTLLLAHRADVHSPEFKAQMENLVHVSDQLVRAKLAENSFLQWVIDQPRQDAGNYEPVKYFEIISYVLQCHPDVNVYNVKGNTPLHLLAKYNEPYTNAQFRLLLHKFESDDMHYDLVNAKGETAADLCAIFSPHRMHFFTSIAGSYISLKCLAARTVQRCVPLYSDYLPKMLEEFVSMH